MGRVQRRERGERRREKGREKREGRKWVERREVEREVDEIVVKEGDERGEEKVERKEEDGEERGEREVGLGEKGKCAERSKQNLNFQQAFCGWRVRKNIWKRDFYFLPFKDFGEQSRTEDSLDTKQNDETNK